MDMHVAFECKVVLVLPSSRCWEVFKCKLAAGLNESCCEDWGEAQLWWQAFAYLRNTCRDFHTSKWISRFLLFWENQCVIFHRKYFCSHVHYSFQAYWRFLVSNYEGWLRYSWIFTSMSRKYNHKIRRARRAVIHCKELLYWIAEKNCPKDIWLP